MEVVVLGATGFCGKAFLEAALKSARVAHVTAFSRRELPTSTATDGKFTSIVAPSTDWPAKLPESPDIVFSGVASTRAAEGGFAAQYKIDHDLQVELAKASRAKGAKAFIVVSSIGANSKSLIFYYKMKGEIEEDIEAIGFETLLILRPGPLVGHRTNDHKGWGSSLVQSIGPIFHRSCLQSIAGYPVYPDEIASAILATLANGKCGTHILESRDILNLSNSS